MPYLHPFPNIHHLSHQLPHNWDVPCDNSVKQDSFDSSSRATMLGSAFWVGVASKQLKARKRQGESLFGSSSTAVEPTTEPASYTSANHQPLEQGQQGAVPQPWNEATRDAHVVYIRKAIRSQLEGRDAVILVRLHVEVDVVVAASAGTSGGRASSPLTVSCSAVSPPTPELANHLTNMSQRFLASSDSQRRPVSKQCYHVHADDPLALIHVDVRLRKMASIGTLLNHLLAKMRNVASHAELPPPAAKSATSLVIRPANSDGTAVEGSDPLPHQASLFKALSFPFHAVVGLDPVFAVTTQTAAEEEAIRQGIVEGEWFERLGVEGRVLLELRDARFREMMRRYEIACRHEFLHDIWRQLGTSHPSTGNGSM